jgi:mRNA interferase MazF
MAVVIARFGMYLVSLDPVLGSEISKTRPCLVVSPDEMNRHIRTVIVAPMTTARKGYPTRVPCRFGHKSGEVALDQLRTVDKTRLVRALGMIDADTSAKVVKVLLEMFA